MGKEFICTIFISLISLTAMAVPAKPGVLTITQGDGTTIQVRLVGDEYSHQYFTPDGYLLVNNNDIFYYATLDENAHPISTGIRASNSRSVAVSSFLSGIDREGIRSRILETFKSPQKAPQRGPGLIPYTYFPTIGEQKALVILVEYKDVSFNTSYDAGDYFSRMLNQPGFKDYGGTGSARDYFIDQSHGQFICDFDVYGPITLSQKRSYYGRNDLSGNDSRPGDMIVEALRQLDAEVDFSQYDRDNNGEIDNVFVFYAGRGEASGGGASSVWPHAWTVTAAGAGTHYFDGKLVDRYACTNEWLTNQPDGVGTFIHEFSHVLGLPDIYSTDYTNSFTLDMWDVMDYGSYNNDGRTPPNYSAFERYALNWLQPTALIDNTTTTLPAISENIAAIIEKENNSNEYFLFENRQQEGWDAHIPGHGMLIWHIDYDDDVWFDNVANNTPSHQHIDIEEADGTQSEYSRDGDSFPGANNVSSFTPLSKPAMKWWDGTSPMLPIYEITESDGIISFIVGESSSGIEQVQSNSELQTIVNGLSIHISGLTNGEVIKIYNLMGSLIAQQTGTSTGEATITVPLPGLYIIHTQNHTSKLFVR